jgi:membrane fusion protein
MSAPPETFPPFLETELPPWVARGPATLLLALFSVAAVAVFVVHVPETVSAAFVLVPVHGADPIRALRSGVVGEVRVTEAQGVAAGEPLFTIASASVGDRAAEWQGLASQAAGAQERLASRRAKGASQRLADGEEAGRLRARLESLARSLEIKKQQLATSREMAKRQRETFDLGLSSWMEMSRVEIEADRLALEVEQAGAEQAETRRELERLRHEAEARRAESQELERGLVDELERARIRGAALDQDLVHGGNQLVVGAPCAGIVLKLAVRGRGAVVQEGDVLAEVACAGERLQAELTLPQGAMALVRPGQPVKLLYDAFPYQRYGARAARIRWISPAGESGGFRAFADLEAESVPVRAERRPLVPGMGGRARVIVGRRTLVSYAFEPIRQLQESLAGAP